MNSRSFVSLAALLLPTILAACSGDSGSAPPPDNGNPSNDGGSGNPPGNNKDSGTNPGGHDQDSGTGTKDSGGNNPQDSSIPQDDAGTDAGNGKDAEGGAPQQHIKTVFIILMENHNWSDITGGNAPYIKNTLLPMASSCDNYFDNPTGVHPSEPNYIWLEAGSNLGFTDDADPSASHKQTTTDHLVSQLTGVNVSWKSYQEDLPAGKCGISATGKYAPKHNPMVFFTDVSGDPPSNTNAGCVQHVRPYTELATDLQGGTVAQYNFITPNLCNDMHDSFGCATFDAVKNGDTWLSTEVPKILASHAYQDNGALFITWDESEGGEFPIGMIVLSPLAKGTAGHPYVGHTKYYHSSFLRTVEEIFHVPLLRDAANQPSLSDLFVSYP